MSRKQSIIISVTVPIAVIILYIFRDFIVKFVYDNGGCMFHILTGYYCPGCGNTRSADALIHGHLLLALRNNISMPFIAMLLALLYAEQLIFSISGKNVHILTRKAFVWWIVLGLFGVYFIIRNFIPEIAPVS